MWIFGDLWCSIWLALDVWMCTASILNLCAISLDRYVAVTRPVTYPSIMSTKRAKLLVAGVWVLSFVICLPQLVGLTKNHKVCCVYSCVVVFFFLFFLDSFIYLFRFAHRLFALLFDFHPKIIIDKGYQKYITCAVGIPFILSSVTVL